MNKIKILLTDDHTLMREGIRAVLALREDMEIVGEAADGDEAVAKVNELSPDVVLMDISMPGMDGLEATRRIKKLNKQTKVLILTQYDNKEYVLSAIKAGCAGFVSKKAVGNELVSAIHIVARGDSFLYPSAATALIETCREHSSTADPYDRLSLREREVLKMIAEGRTSREIADSLFITLKTVMGHSTRIYRKLNLRGRNELTRYAIRRGLIRVDV